MIEVLFWIGLLLACLGLAALFTNADAKWKVINDRPNDLSSVPQGNRAGHREE